MIDYLESIHVFSRKVNPLDGYMGGYMHMQVRKFGWITPYSPRKFLPFSPPTPQEFQLTIRGGGVGGMDILWNHTILQVLKSYFKNLQSFFKAGKVHDKNLGKNALFTKFNIIQFREKLIFRIFTNYNFLVKK